MTIYIGADHRGFELKTYLVRVLQEAGYDVQDMGAAQYDEADDYPDFASAVAGKVRDDYENSKGVVICGSGAGVSVVANKFSRVRAAVALTPDQAFDSRNDDDANVLALAASYTDAEAAAQIVTTWLGTPFSGDARHVRRIKKISEIEEMVKER